MNELLVTTGVLLSSFYIFKRAVNYTASGIIVNISATWCLILALLYAFNPFAFPFIAVRVVYCIASILFIFLLTQIELGKVISAYLLSFGISYLIYYISSFMVALVLFPVIGSDYSGYLSDFENKPIYSLMYFIIFILHLIFSHLVFRIKRIKNGFPFLQSRYAFIAVLISTGAVLALVMWLHYPTVDEVAYVIILFVLSALIIGAGIYLWIKRAIKLFYIKKLKERSIEKLNMELSEKSIEIQRMTEQNNILRAANHKITHRLAVLEQGVIELLKKTRNGNHSMKINDELSVTLADIKHLSQDYFDDINLDKHESPLPSTKINAIDNLFKYFSFQYMENDINFSLKINGSISYMVANVISQSKLETMIGDHLQDALIAINESDNIFRSVLVILGVAGDCYEFTVFDSGISFEVSTLILLGTEHITTHADTGGSGTGFMTTFETMRECGASLVISEKPTSSTDYTKSVTVRFDGKNQYIIETYRAEAFPEDDRYIIKKR